MNDAAPASALKLEGPRQIQLDVVRGLAVLLAIGWHLNTGAGGIVGRALQWPGSRFGWAGVDLFFVLSGFLVGGLVLSEVARTGAFERRRFLVRRALRLWPVVWAYLFAQFVTGRYPAGDYLPQVLLHVQNFWTTPFHHLWSLAVEEHFYLALTLMSPLLVAHVARPARLYRALAAVIVGVTALRTAAWFADVPALALQWHTQYRADGLALGMLLAAVAQHHPERFRRLQRPAFALAALVLGCGVALAALDAHRSLIPVVGFPLAAAASAALVLLLHGRPLPRAIMPPARMLAWIGLYSYSLYIWHIGVGRAAGRQAQRLFGADSAWPVAASYLAAIAVAYIMARLIERPSLMLRDRLLPKPKEIKAR